MTQKIKFVVNAVKWFDKVNGNTYHSCQITRTKDGAILYCPFQYGYGDQYRQTAITKMVESGWVIPQYKGQNWKYERENDYPILWNVTHGLKRDAVANGKE